MALAIAAEPIPLATDEHGVVRVGGTRVTLDTVAAAFDGGATAEEIAQDYPVLSLADVYATIGYLLRHDSDVRVYLARRAVEREAVRREIEERFDYRDFRRRLMARLETRRRH